MGKIRNPQYRIVVADSRTKRDGKAIENIGIYHPREEPSRIEVNSERAQYWLSVGAQPSEPVIAILSKTGDWQRFKGLPAPTEPLKVAAPRVDRRAVYEAEAKSAAGIAEPAKAGKAEPAARTAKAEPAAKPAKRAAKKATKAAAAEPEQSAAATEEKPAAEQPAAEQSAAEQSAAEQPAEEKPAAEQPAAQTEEQSGAAAGEQA
jgi:small subunit ribosomal protein S16